MPERTLTFCFVKEPLTLIMGTIGPILDTISMSELLNIWIIITSSVGMTAHAAASAALAPLRGIVSARYLHLGVLISLFHLASIDRIVRIYEHVSVDEARLVAELRQQLLISFHLNLIIASHRISHRRSLLHHIVSLLATEG
jgi:hypothetical protein